MGGASSGHSRHGRISGKVLKRDTCFCGLEIVLLQSKTADNPGRWFWQCPLWDSNKLRCEFFVWADEADDEFEELVDCGNNRDKAKLRDEGGKRVKERGNNTQGQNKIFLNVMLEMIDHMKKEQKHMCMIEYYLKGICILFVMLLILVIIALIR